MAGRSPALEAELRSRRHVPPGTQLPKPSLPATQQLLADLEALPDSLDPVDWLQHERLDLAVIVALRAALEFLRGLVSGVAAAQVANTHHGLYERALLDGLLDLPADATIFSPLAAPWDGSERALLAVLRAARTICLSSVRLDLDPPVASDPFLRLVEAWS
jgi:hypothetical protein